MGNGVFQDLKFIRTQIKLRQRKQRESPLLSTSSYFREEGKLKGTFLFSGDSFRLCLFSKFTEEKSKQPIPGIKRPTQFNKYMLWASFVPGTVLDTVDTEANKTCCEPLGRMTSL